MPVVVYWLEAAEPAAVAEAGDALPPDAAAGPRPACRIYEDGAMSEALAWTEQLRRAGHQHVCISSELAGQVGAAGVAAVEGGMTPDGQRYEWSKAHRAGRMRR